MSTFKLAPNENGADTADDHPAQRAFREFVADLAESDLNPTHRVRMRVELDPDSYAALRRHYQRPYRPKPSSFVVAVSEGGKHFGMVEFVRKDAPRDDIAGAARALIEAHEKDPVGLQRLLVENAENFASIGISTSSVQPPAAGETSST